MEVSCQLHVPTTLTQEKSPEKEAGWVPEPVDTVEMGKISYPCWELNLGQSACTYTELSQLQ
jgi:hypothetical protein